MKRGVIPQEYGPSGPAKVTILKSGVRVAPTDSQIVYQFPFDQAPPYAKKMKSPGVASILISSDRTKLFSISPVAGSHLARFVRFGRDRNNQEGPPAPFQTSRPSPWKAGEMLTQLVFRVELEFLGGPFKGGQDSIRLVYRSKTQGFAPTPENKVMVAGRGRDAQLLQGFLEATGVWQFEMDFTDNILPALEALILKQKNQFVVSYDKGWARSFEAALRKK